ncbi:cupin domain-containing protein [Natronobacterium texcoconense]|uniref:Cupin domain-containing protein n=1 Tax=Natronobacterium texcoconense TaxID=1095778 RepID=A0A1H0ZE35_NATTX|nr:cupin domain-containing protein [Natronobacterium texcoconense]SDQ25653.1 Cupin domain-containing protein [Natronobacterium texcoconense]
MGYDTAAKADPESVVPEEFGGMWFLKDELESDSVGFTVLELEPGGKGKEHDETETGQEEIYYVLEGEIEVELTDSDETVSLEADEAIRLDPDETRQIRNEGDERAKLILVGAPL